MDNIKQNFQAGYDNLIELANNAYKNSQNPRLIESELSDMWLGKSEGYEYGASMFYMTAAACLIFLDTKTTLRQQEINQARHEECEADVENEKEMVYEDSSEK